MLSNLDIKELLLGDNPIVRNVDLDLIDRGRTSPVQPASIDLHVGEILVPTERHGNGRNQDGVQLGSDRYTVPSGGSVVLLTREVINFSAYFAGLMFPKSSGLAERGVLLTNFGHVDPGYRGRLRYSLVNMGSADLEIRQGDAIACLCIFALRVPASPDFSELRAPGKPIDDEGRTREFVRYLSPELLSLGRITNEAKRVARDVILEQGFFALLISTVVAVVVGVSSAAVALAVSWFLFIEPRMEKAEAKMEQTGSVAGLNSATAVPRPTAPKARANPPPQHL